MVNPVCCVLQRKRTPRGGLSPPALFSQVLHCDNLIVHRRTALDQSGQRLLDANRTVGQPTKITTIFGRPAHRGTFRSHCPSNTFTTAEPCPHVLVTL